MRSIVDESHETSLETNKQIDFLRNFPLFLFGIVDQLPEHRVSQQTCLIVQH